MQKLYHATERSAPRNWRTQAKKRQRFMLEDLLTVSAERLMLIVAGNINKWV